MTVWYSTGTAEATNGSATVTGTTTAWLANVKVGDEFYFVADDRGYEVTAVNSNTEIEISPVYAGSTGSGKAYRTKPIAPTWNIVSELSIAVAELLSAVDAELLYGSGAPSDDLGKDTDVYIRTDVAEIYAKESGTWELKAVLSGPAGDPGPSYQATSTSSVIIDGAVGNTRTFSVVESARGYSAGQRLRAADDADSANYVEGRVASYSHPTLIINVDRIGGSGTKTAWDINITGDVGPANSLSIGSVTASSPGGSASASITGSAPAQTLNLTIPRGNAGPANSLSIGTVTEGSAAASITGTAPTQTLNLTLPKGDAATIEVGDVTTVDPDDPATVTNSGTTSEAVFDFEIPRGEQGIAGATGPNTGLDYAWDTGTADSDPGNGDIRVDSGAWGFATNAYVSKTGRNGESLGDVIAALCGANNDHRAHFRLFPVLSPATYLEAEVLSDIVDGGNYWKIPLTVTVASLAQPSASDVMCLVLTRSGEAASTASEALAHAMLGGL